tara:strand:+ start:915 stop:1304 length:390 start_codon:yes stop_codon:yes gene_type:complete
MANISIKLNLAQLKHAIRNLKGKDKQPIECLVIPIDENLIFRGEKGLYLDLTAIEIKNKVGDSKDTHLIKQQVGKEAYEAMSEEQKRAMPILGNAIYWGRREAEPNVSDSLSESAVDQYLEEDDDDLPF